MSSNGPSSTTSNTSGTRELVRGALTHITGIGAALSAWGYLAGYTYRDQFLTSFGLSFGAVEASTVETLIQGYYVTLYAIWKGAWPLTKLLAIEAIAVVSILLFLAYAVWSGWGWAVSLKTALQTQTTWPDRILPWLLMTSLSVLFIIGAVPAGSLAANYDVEAYEKNIRLGFCRDYRVGTSVRHGLLLAQDSNVSWLLTPNEVVLLETKQLHPMAPFGRNPRRHPAQVGRSKAGPKPKTFSCV